MLLISPNSSKPPPLRWNTCSEKASGNPTCSPAAFKDQGPTREPPRCCQVLMSTKAQGCCLSQLPVTGTCPCVQHLWLGSHRSRTCCLLSKPGGLLSSENVITLSFCWACSLFYRAASLVPAGARKNRSANGSLLACGMGVPRSSWVCE